MSKINRTVFFIAGMLMMALAANAQNKEISQVRTILKSGKDFDKAENILLTLMAADSLQRHNIKVKALWVEAVRKELEEANEKLYLKQKYDTAAFFDINRRLFTVAASLDSLDMLPDKKGRVKLEYRKTNAAYLHQVRMNVYYGGTYHIRNNDYKTAYDYFETYVKTADEPMFTGYDYATTDSMMPQAAYWATFCGYKLQDGRQTLAYADLALRDTAKAAYTYQYMCEAYKLQKNDSAYVETLRKGFALSPEFPYFFSHLADYYTSAGQYRQVIDIAEDGLKVNANSMIFLLAKSIALLNLEKYDDCIAVSKQLQEINDSLPEPYLNIATSYLNQALAVEKENQPRKNHTKLTQLYAAARPYMEKYRKLQQDDEQHWAPALYRIYLHLNMGTQFEEIDRIMRKR